MQHLYMMISRQKTWGAILAGLWLCLLTAGGLMAQVPSCGPNQLLTGYFTGATTVVSTTGTVTSATSVLGVTDGVTPTLNANSGVTLDMGSVLPAGNSLIFTYKSADANAPLQVLVASSATGPYTNIAQLPASTTLTTLSVSLPLNTRYVQLGTTGTVYYPDAVTYPIYKCVNNPAPTCAAGQTLLSYPAGSQGVNGTTGTVTTSTNATGPADGAVATVNTNGSITLDLGSVVAAGNVLSLAYYSQYTSTYATPMQVWVSSTGAAGSFINISSFQPSSSASMTSGSLMLPLDTRYVQLVTSGTYSTYYIDALTYPLYSCVTLPSTACASGLQSVAYNAGAQGLNNTTGTVTNSTNVIGVPDGTVAAISANSSLIVDMGSALAAGKTLTFTYSSGDKTAPMQIWTATAVGGPYTFIGTMPGSTASTTGQITLPLGAEYIKMVTSGTAYAVDAVAYPVYSCVTTPNTSCPTGQVSVSTQSGAQGLNNTTGTVSNSTNILGTSDGSLAVLSASSSLIVDMGSVIAAGNQVNFAYLSANTTAPLQILVATNLGGPYTNVAQLPGSTASTVNSIVLPVGARYIQMQTTGTSYSVDAVTQILYSCLASPAACAAGQQSISYPAGGAASVYTTTGLVSSPGNATGVIDGAYTIMATATLTLDLGSTVVAPNVFSLTYYSQYPAPTASPMQVRVATTPTGPYTLIGRVQPTQSSVTVNLDLPTNARYIQLVSVDDWSAYSVDGLSYLAYACVTPTSTSCAAGQQSVSYQAGAQGVGATTGTVTNPTNIVGVSDGAVVSLAANSSFNVDMGSALPAGTVLTLAYSSANTTAPMQVLVASSAGGPYTFIGTVAGSTSSTSQLLTLPIAAQYIQLKTTSTAYSPDAITYPVYTCVTPPNTKCATGQTLVGYTQGAVGTNGTVGTVSNATNATGSPDGAVAGLSASSSITLDMGSAVTAGNSLLFTYSSANTTAPLQVLVASSLGGPYTNIGQLPGSTSSTTNSIQLPLDARYVQLKTTGTTYSVDAVTYPIFSCVSSPLTTCASGQSKVSYTSGAQGVGTTTGTVTTATNATGNPDGNLAALSANSSLILNLGSVVSAGNSINLTYLSGNTTAPLQVLVSTNAGGPYTNIAQLSGSTSSNTVSIALPLNAQYVQLQTTATNYSVDAVTQTLYSCVSSPVTSCSAGQVSSSYQSGIQGVGATTGTVTNPTNIVGVPDGTVATVNTNGSVTLDFGSVVAAGNVLALAYYSQYTSTYATPMQILVSKTGAVGSFTNVSSFQPTSSASITNGSFTLPLDARYVQLVTSGTYSTYYIDALTYPVYTCVTPVSSTCGTGQQSVSYQSGAQGLNNTSGTVTNSTNLLGSPDGAVATVSANSSVILDLGSVITGGNSLRVTYSSANTTAPMQILVATNLGGPYVNIAQLAGSTTTTTQTVNLPIDARYVQLLTTGTAYSPDAITYPVYTCVSNPASICSTGQQVVSYNTGAVGLNGATSVTNPSYGTGTPDGAYAVMAANGVLTLDLGSVVAGGNTVSVNYKSGDLVAPMQVLVATNLGGPYTSIGQMPASTANTTGSLTLPVDARYVQLQTKATTYSVDAVTRPVYTCVSSTITSGIVYLDGNINGVLNSIEQGVGGVTVNAYDTSGNLVGTTTTSAGNPTLNIPAGYYSFSNLTAGQPYKLEFTNWPSQYSPSVYGINDGTTVQFIQGVTQNNDLGLYLPSSICSLQDNSRMVFGTGLSGASTSVGSWDYLDRGKAGYGTSSGGGYSVTNDIASSKIGVPLGVASQRPTNWVYMAPLSTNMPGVFPQAPDGSSAIYIANYNGQNGDQTYQGTKLLVKLSDLGINVGSTATQIGGNPFGVQGLGGLDFSQSGDTMYVVNMSKGTLVGVDVSQVDYNNLPATKPTSAFEITPPSSLANCSGGVYRPTALKQYGGKIYMGGVCDAEISQSNTDLKGVVLAYDPASGTWSKALSYPITFTGGGSSAGSESGTVQYSWANTTAAGLQPVMLDLAFADNGAMVIGTTDRHVYGAATSNNQTGYVMGAWPNGDGTYTLESQGKLGPYTGLPSFNSGDPGAPDGPGGQGWFFQQNSSGGHPYAFNGGLYIKTGTNYVVAGYTDAGGLYLMGASYLNLTTGIGEYSTPLIGGQKISRITGTDQVCDAVPPIEIGNRVWKDTNSNGIQDAGEPSLAGVTVELRDANGNLVATAVTDANGNYIFSNQAGSSTTSQKYGLPITQNTNYTIDVASLGTDPSTAGLTLTNISPAPGETAGTTNTGATIDNNDAFLVNGLPTISVKTGPDGIINHNYDFGFIGSSFDLALTKSLAPGQASVIKPGSNVTFAVVVYNQGSQPAYTIQLADYIPAGLTLNDANWTANGSTATLNTPIAGSLAAGSSTTVTITFTVSSTASGPLVNKAEIASADNDTNPNNTPPTDVDSTPDTNPTNDAGGNPNSGSDNSITGNGTGTPGDTNPATDEDDEDPAIIYVQPCTLGGNLLTTEAHCGKADGRATVTVNTGVAPYTYAWSTGASTSAITGLSGGQTFTVTVTDANGCKDVLVGTIQSTGGPVLSGTAVAASCQQATGSASVTATGGTGSYTYLWSTGATTATLSNVASGTYTVTVTDGAGCVSSLAVIVPGTSPLSVVATPTSSSCLGANGSVALTVSGGSPAYNYVWNTGATTQNLSAVAGGTYQVKVTDANGCTAVATAVVPNTSAPTVSGTPTNPICFGTSTGSVSLVVSGGSGSYSYQWDNGSTAQSLTGVQAGIYNVVVTDGSGCRSGASFTLTQPSRIVADIQSVSAVCNAQGGITGGTLQVVSVVGGTPGYSYLWSTGSASTSLTGLAAGTYSLTVTDSKGCLALGQAVIDPWPTCAKASLGDYVWLDTNSNGQQDPTETGVASVTAVLHDAVSGTVVSTTVTDGTGHYLFTNLDPGSYYVVFTAPSGTTFTTPNSGNDATDSDVASLTGQSGSTGVYSLTAGQQDLTVDAGLIPLKASLGDYVWFDTNQNGQQDPTETGVASVTVVLHDATSGTVVSTTVTDSQGKYLFTNLNPGSYYVVFTAPSGTTFTTPNSGNDATDSDVASLTGQSGSTGVYSLTAGQQDLTVDAGLIPLKASLGDYVWFDTNQNGQQDPTETGVASVTAVLHDAVSGTVVSTTVTDGQGKYLFTNLNPGSYYVVFTAPSGTTFTTPNSGADATDSDVASLTGQSGSTGIYSLTAGQQDLTVDAGLVPLKASLGDYVWFDTNQNGQQDPTETGVASVTAVLHDAVSGTVVSTTVTDGTGHYLFTNLNPGSYYVVFTAPSGTTFTTPNSGADATDSDVASLTGQSGSTGIYSLTAGQQDLTVDAGLVPLKASLGDYVWFDTNMNGQQDPTETGVASVTVVLHDATSGTVVSTTLTDGTGHYLFTNLNPGSYYVVFTAPTGQTFTTPNSGNDATDSDAGVGGQTGVYSLTAGQQDLTVDAGIIPIPVFDLALKKTLAAGQSANVMPGSNVTFTVTIYNQGNVDATNVQVTDYIPAGLTLNDAAWTANGSLATLNSVIASLPAGQSVTRPITFLVNANAPSSLTNTAEISSASNAQNLPDVDSSPDNNPSNDGTPINDDLNGNHKGNPADDEDDSDPEVITVSPAPVFDLALKKTLGPGQSATVVAGSNVTFTVTIYNQGNVDATNVQVTDYIPAGLVLNDANWTANGSLATLTTAIANLSAGQSLTQNITFTVSSSFVGGTLTNVAEISSASNAQNLPDKDSTPDSDPTNDGTPVNDDISGDHKNNPSQDEDDSDPEPITVTPLCTALGLNTGTTLALCGQSNGIATVVVNAGSGVAPYTYQWTNAQGTAIGSSSVVQGLAPGLYTVTVTDSKGCTGQKQVTISSTNAPAIVAQVASTSCGLANGSASVQVTSGSGNYTYQWTTSTGTVVGSSASVANLPAGTYTVNVVDANGCNSMTSVVVGTSTPLVVVATAQNAVCGQANGSISAQVSGGSPS
ncbi:SdrD B-like domain-containing protein, partial [Spirosoma litoris]